MNADIARAWILANGIAQLVSAVFGIIGIGLRKALGVDTAEAALSTLAVYVAIETR